MTSGFAIPTGQFEFHSAVVNKCPVNTVAEGFKGSDAEHSRLLFPKVLIGSPPERVFGKYTTRDYKKKERNRGAKKVCFESEQCHVLDYQLK